MRHARSQVRGQAHMFAMHLRLAIQKHSLSTTCSIAFSFSLSLLFLSFAFLPLLCSCALTYDAIVFYVLACVSLPAHFRLRQPLYATVFYAQDTQQMLHTRIALMPSLHFLFLFFLCRCVPSLCGSGLRSPPNGSACIGMGSTSKNFWGFQLFDEPGEGLFGEIGNWTRELEAQRPGVLSCKCVCARLRAHNIFTCKRVCAWQARTHHI
jgi:hypothetical protein